MIAANQFNTVRKQLSEAETLPSSCYTSQEFYDLEVQNIFRKKWLLIGRADEWKEPGAFKCYNRFGIPFFITKDDSGKIRAFANSCRHRGSELLSGSGTVSRFICPYHSWTYALDGSLRGVTGMEYNPSFDKSQYGLFEIKLDVWQSFVFVNFSANCEPLATQIGDLDKYLAPYDFDNVVTVGRDEYVVNTNWKALVENSMEWLHHPTVHKSSIAGKVATIERNVVVGSGDYLLIQSQAKGVSRSTLENEQGFPPVSTLTGAPLEGSHYVLIYPFAMIGCDIDSVWYKQMIPEGPDKVRNIATYCFHKETMARPDFEAIAPNYYRRFQKVVKEDNAAMERQLIGLMSPFARQGRYSDREILVHKIDNWVLDHIFPQATNGGAARRS